MDFGPALKEPDLCETCLSQARPGRDRPGHERGRFKNTPLMRIDKLFKPKWPPRTPRETPRIPRRPPQEGLKKSKKFQKKKEEVSRPRPEPTFSPSPAPASPGGSGGAVWLEKPIDSRTWRLSPTTGSRFGPISASWGLKRARSGRARLGKSWFEVHLGRRVWPVWSSSR